MASFEKRSAGWTVRFRVITPTGESTKRLSGFKTKAEANREMIKYLSEHPSEDPAFQPSSITYFKELAALWLEHKQHMHKESSYITARSRLNNLIMPTFGEKKIVKILPADILLWQTTILAPYAFSYKRSLRRILTSIFNFGERYYSLPNPIKRVEPLLNTQPIKEMQIWTKEEFKAFITEVTDPVMNCYFRLLYIAGCRKGEAAVLTPADIDYKTNTIHFCKTYSSKTSSEGYTVTAPKTDKSNRRINMPATFMADLRQIYCDTDHFIFGGSRPFSEQKYTYQFKKATQRADLKRIRIHDLRHSCATYLLSSGIRVEVVSRRLGHSSITQTLNTYAHVIPADQDKVADVTNDI